MATPTFDDVAISFSVEARPPRVWVMTSSAEHRDLVDGYRLGVNSYVQKPVDFSAYQKLIKELGSYWLGINHISPGVVPPQN